MTVGSNQCLWNRGGRQVVIAPTYQIRSCNSSRLLARPTPYVFAYRAGTQPREVCRRRREGVSILLTLSTEKSWGSNSPIQSSISSWRSWLGAYLRGASGPAAKLGIPRQTLESTIKRMVSIRTGTSVRHPGRQARNHPCHDAVPELGTGGGHDPRHNSGWISAAGGFRHRKRHAAGMSGQGVRPVLHHGIGGTRPRTHRGSRDRSESPRDN